jgi:cyclopropane fatty-acyl-phospholipid synthase-like methyltransferase
MKPQKVQDFYSQKARFYQRFFVGFLKWEKVLEAFFTANDYLHAGMRILDAGCGSGPVTKVLYRLAQARDLAGMQFYGFDLTPAMLDLFAQWIQNEGAQNIHIRQADVLDLRDQLPPDWAGYDLVVSSTMLEYIAMERRHQALANLKGVLRGNGSGENGRLLLFVTRRTWVTRLTGQKWWGAGLFDRVSLAAELRRSGFSHVHFRPMPGRWDSFLLAAKARIASSDKEG